MQKILESRTALCSRGLRNDGAKGSATRRWLAGRTDSSARNSAMYSAVSTYLVCLHVVSFDGSFILNRGSCAPRVDAALEAYQQVPKLELPAKLVNSES